MPRRLFAYVSVRSSLEEELALQTESVVRLGYEGILEKLLAITPPYGYVLFCPPCVLLPMS